MIIACRAAVVVNFKVVLLASKRAILQQWGWHLSIFLLLYENHSRGQTWAFPWLLLLLWILVVVQLTFEVWALVCTIGLGANLDFWKRATSVVFLWFSGRRVQRVSKATPPTRLSNYRPRCTFKGFKGTIIPSELAKTMIHRRRGFKNSLKIDFGAQPTTGKWNFCIWRVKLTLSTKQYWVDFSTWFYTRILRQVCL